MPLDFAAFITGTYNNGSLIIIWGESGFAGSNYFTYLMHSKDSEPLMGALKDEDLKGTYVSTGADASKGVVISRQCLRKVRHISGEFYHFEATC